MNIYEYFSPPQKKDMNIKQTAVKSFKYFIQPLENIKFGICKDDFGNRVPTQPLYIILLLLANRWKARIILFSLKHTYFSSSI
jgi:hypothetical protein